LPATSTNINRFLIFFQQTQKLIYAIKLQSVKQGDASAISEDMASAKLVPPTAGEHKAQAEVFVVK